MSSQQSNQYSDKTAKYILHTLEHIRTNSNGTVSTVKAESKADSILKKLDEDTPDISAFDIKAVIENHPNLTVETNGPLDQEQISDVNPPGDRPQPLDDILSNPSNNKPGSSLQYEFSIEPISTDDSDTIDHTSISALTKNRAAILREQGFETYHKLATAEPADILSLPTFENDAEAKQIINEAGNQVGSWCIAQSAYSDEISYYSSQISKHDENIADSWIASDVDKPAGKPTKKAFNGLPILEEQNHPFIDDVDDLPPYYARVVDDHQGSDSSEKDIELIARLLAKNNFTPNLIGPAGVGKSLIGKYIGAIRNQPSISLNMDGGILTENLFGIHHLENDAGKQISDEEAEELLENEDDETLNNITIVWKDGPVTRAVRYGWLLILDEINAAPPKVLIALHQLLERNGNLHIKERNEVIERHEQFRLITTMNPPNSGFHGTNKMNKAFLNRLISISIDWLPKDKEKALLNDIINSQQRTILTGKQLDEIVSMAGKFRNEAKNDTNCPELTPRDLMKIAEIYDSPKQTLRSASRILIKGMTPGQSNLSQAYMQYIRDSISSK